MVRFRFGLGGFTWVINPGATGVKEMNAARQPELQCLSA